MEQLRHFSHEHLLSLVQFPHHNNIDVDKEEEEEGEGKDEHQEDKDDFVANVGKCKMCMEEIYSFHLCYYSCKDCDYPLHKFCAQLPTTQQNHPLHPGHNLTLAEGFQFCDSAFNISYSFNEAWYCDICQGIQRRFYNYHCSICNFNIDIICATMTEQKMDHPSHPHQLQRFLKWMISFCNACGRKHSGTFYQCTTCSWLIHLDCALLPAKLFIQQYTNEVFSHPHLLTLAYSFPQIEKRAKFYPHCRICDDEFDSFIWHYRCNKCQYYIHVRCATSISVEAFMSILMPAGLGKLSKNFKDGDHPKLVKCPFPDESLNLLKDLFVNRGEIVLKRQIDGEMFNHQDPLILFDAPTSLLNKTVSLHDPMRKIELLCNGCVRPIMDFPFYKCSQHQCGFVLHEWCTRLPSEIQNHHDHPEHTLVLLPKLPKESLGMFLCEICCLYSNGFAYGCIQCEYYVDINCAFIPDVITHDAHRNHLLQRFEYSTDISEKYCKACEGSMEELLGFRCSTCDFNVDIACALLLPGTTRHKYDKHPLILRYNPAENHSSEYFCDICEDELNPEMWFYHCSTCASSMHTACAPLILQCEQSTSSNYLNPDPVFKFINVKFGGTHEITDHPHPLTFVQGINEDGQCIVCNEPLQYNVIFKCFECLFVCHTKCARVLSSGHAICAD